MERPIVQSQARGASKECPFLSSEGLLTTVERDQKPQGEIGDRSIMTRREWEAIASAWSLKQLVAIWNRLPGVKPIQKFTNRQIALERIWLVIAAPQSIRQKPAAQPEGPHTPFREGSKAAQIYA